MWRSAIKSYILTTYCSSTDEVTIHTLGPPTYATGTGGWEMNVAVHVVRLGELMRFVRWGGDFVSRDGDLAVACWMVGLGGGEVVGSRVGWAF